MMPTINPQKLTTKLMTTPRMMKRQSQSHEEANANEEHHYRLIETHMVEEAEMMNILGQTDSVRFESDGGQTKPIKPNAYRGTKVITTAWQCHNITSRRTCKSLANNKVQMRDADLEELRQLHEMNAIKPEKDLTREKKRGALQYLMYQRTRMCRRNEHTSTRTTPHHQPYHSRLCS
jgi:hypothetical protein